MTAVVRNTSSRVPSAEGMLPCFHTSGGIGCWRRRVVALALLAAVPTHARVCAPRVVSPHNADAYSMRTFAEHLR
jgi:hypothetical protein